MPSRKLIEPRSAGHRTFDNADDAVAAIRDIHDGGTKFLLRHLGKALCGAWPRGRCRAYYPEISITTNTHARLDSRFAFGFVAEPGTYSTTLTQPRLFDKYLRQQVSLLLQNHGVPVTVGPSQTPIPVHFAIGGDFKLGPMRGHGPPRGGDGPGAPEAGGQFPLRDHFDVPDLSTIGDEIANCTAEQQPGGAMPLAPFTAQRVDYSLARLAHYTATDPEHFQNHVLFTNYQFYVDEFAAFAQEALYDSESGYAAFVAPGNRVSTQAVDVDMPAGNLPQMPAYHLKRENASGISLVNIGIGPSNAKTATDHVAVLRPHAWLMLGHCAGLRNSQNLGDYVLAHAYVREDHVLDADLPVWIPVPALAEVQIALEAAVEEVTELSGFELKRIMRTGTVATIDNRNWELRDQSGPVQRLSQSRAIALDMESATIAANGFRFRVPYGSLLCVSDKPLHGELKLPGTATEFYRTQVGRHLKIGIRAMEMLREMPLERLHSRKLRSFDETAFL